MAVATRKPLKSIHLREDFHRASGAKLRVDREAGIIYKIKILGWESDNRRKYLPEAGRNALSLYEGCKAYSDHPTRGRPEETRANRDALGIWRGVTWENDGLYADLHFLKTHPLAETICEDCERGLGVFGASHNADGKGETRDGTFVISSITEVRSVDLVTDPATVSNLWEGRRIAAKKVKDVLLEAKVMDALDLGRRKRLKAICEAMGDGTMMEDDDAGKDHKDHLYSAMRACEEAGDDETAGKIHGLLKPIKPGKGSETDDDDDPSKTAEEGDGSGEGGDDDIDDHTDDAMKKKEKGAAKESRNKKPAPGATVLTEAKAKALCKLAGITATTDLLESVVGLPEDRAVSVLALVKGNGAQASAPRGSAPRSQGQRPVQVTESRVAKDAAEQAALLLS